MLKLLCIIVMLITSCGDHERSIPKGGNSSKGEVVFRKYLPAKVKDLDPIKSFEVATANVGIQLYDSLFELNSAMEPVPHLVDSYSYDPKNKVYVFELKKNIYFHNGKELTSDDVVFTFKRICEQKRWDIKVTEIIAGCSPTGDLKNAAFGITPSGRYGFRIKLISHYPPFLLNIASHSFSILPDNYGGISEDQFWKKPITTGAYMLESIDEDLIILKANSNYFLGKPSIDLIKYVIAPYEQIKEMTISGEIDDPGAYRFDDIPNSDFVPYKVYNTIICFLGFNLKKYPYNNIWFRKAIASVIDGDHIVKELDSKGLMRSGGFVPYGALGYLPELKNPGKNISNFKKYIKNAGFENVADVPVLNLITTAPFSLPKLLAEVKKQLEDVGLKVNVDEYLLTDLIEKIKASGTPDLTLLKIKLNQPETYHLLEYFKSNYPLKLYNNSNKEYDRILDASQRTDDRLKRGDYYQKANRMIFDNVWTVNIFYDVFQTAYINKRFNMPAVDYLGPEFIKIRNITVND